MKKKIVLGIVVVLMLVSILSLSGCTSSGGGKNDRVGQSFDYEQNVSGRHSGGTQLKFYKGETIRWQATSSNLTTQYFFVSQEELQEADNYKIYEWKEKYPSWHVGTVRASDKSFTISETGNYLFYQFNPHTEKVSIEGQITVTAQTTTTSIRNYIFGTDSLGLTAQDLEVVE